ncbi:MAG TPA: TetR family transcriptional regulator [Galbitalea sp.]|jgi:AcrR family transcriptional regulator
MVTRDPEAKKRQLLDAALQEFAAHGIAGARVDQIAKAAGVSAGLVYTYFGSKDELFAAVFDDIVDGTLTSTPITPGDLAEYAGRLFDRYEAHPEVQRFVNWYRLEAGSSAGLHAASLASMVAKTAVIQEAQDAGTLTKFLPAIDLLGVILQLSSLWENATPEYSSLVAGHTRDERRRVITESVAALLAR